MNDEFIRYTGGNIEPRHSTLLFLISDSTPGKVMEGRSDFHPKVYLTSLEEEDETQLRAAFGEEN